MKTKANKDFDKDLDFGMRWEDFVENIRTGKILTEVKAERDIWRSTGNIAVEVECNGISSGLTATKSEIWEHLLTENGHFIQGFTFRVDQLRKYIMKLHSQGKLRLVSGGDGNRARMALLPIKDLHLVAYE